MKNIEPQIYRQRLIIEAKYSINVNKEIVRDYLLTLSKKLNMNLVLLKPIVTSATGKGKAKHDGFEGVIIWVESGAVIYVWTKFKFLTVDIYSCKAFDNQFVVKFTTQFFKIVEIEYQIV